jgi:hypothetical protein
MVSAVLERERLDYWSNAVSEVVASVEWLLGALPNPVPSAGRLRHAAEPVSNR